nr:hypothetical protein [Brevibacillus daliensis]
MVNKNKVVYMVIGIDLDGNKDEKGMWISESESGQVLAQRFKRSEKLVCPGYPHFRPINLTGRITQWKGNNKLAKVITKRTAL